MKLAQIHSRLLEILAAMGVSFTALTDQANFARDLGLDSLDITDLILQVETNFGIRIPDENWEKLQTVGQLKQYLAEELIFN